MGARISEIEYYLPDKILDNFQLSAEFPEWEADKIAGKIGVIRRHIAAENETAVDMAFRASKKALDKFDPAVIDFIILCTQSPDYFLPASACVLHEMLKLGTNAGALDINQGCSGYIYGLALAKGLINSNISKNILLVTAETYSKHIHPRDKSNRSIFGDAAAATIITASDTENILDFELGTDGAGMNNLIVQTGGFRKKYDSSIPDKLDSSGNVINENHLFMNGPEIFNFTIGKVPGLVEDVLNRNGLSIEEIDYIIFHQANKYILEYLRKKLKFDPAKFYLDMEETGNTVSSTIPIALKMSLANGIVKKGDKVLLLGFGVGYSWGATIIEV